MSKIEILDKVKKINYNDWFLVCMKFITLILICMICSIVTLVTIGKIISGLDGVLGVGIAEWISIVGTVISGLFGVLGGIYSSKYIIKYNNDKEIENTTNFIRVSIKSEMKLNREILALNKDGKKLKFSLEEWEKIKNSILKLERIYKFANMSRYISDLYKWIGYYNNLLYIEPNIVKSSENKLLTVISQSLIKADEEINEQLGDGSTQANQQNHSET